MYFVGLCFGENYPKYLNKYYDWKDTRLYCTKEEAIDIAKGDQIANYMNAIQDSSNWDENILNRGCFISDEEAWNDVQEWCDVIIDKKGNVYSDYNPEAIFDWYEIGRDLPLKSGKFASEAYLHEIDLNKLKEPYVFFTEEGELIKDYSVFKYIDLLDKNTLITNINFHI